MRTLALPLVAVLLGLAGDAAAQQTQTPAPAAAVQAPPGGTSAADLAQQAVDPTASLMTFNFKYTAIPELHETGQDLHTFAFQPVIPFRAWGTSHILRTTVTYNLEGPSGSGLGDVTIFDLFIINKKKGRWGVGPVLKLDPRYGEDRGTFAVGPAVGYVTQKGKWTMGAFNQNLFGDSTNITSLQPVLAYQLGNGFALSTGDAQWTFDWDREQIVNVPIGIALNKVGRIGSQPVKWSFNPEYNARTLRGTPGWSLRFGLAILAPAG